MRPPGSARRLLLAGIASLLACATGAGAATISASTAAPAPVADPLADPLESPRWGDMRKEFFDAQPVVFDARIKVSGPAVAEQRDSRVRRPAARAIAAVAAEARIIVHADQAAGR